MWFWMLYLHLCCISCSIRKHFDVSQEANCSVFTKFLYGANAGPEDIEDLTVWNEVGGCTCHGVSRLSVTFSHAEWLCPAQSSSGSLISPPLIFRPLFLRLWIDLPLRCWVLVSSSVEWGHRTKPVPLRPSSWAYAPHIGTLMSGAGHRCHKHRNIEVGYPACIYSLWFSFFFLASGKRWFGERMFSPSRAL